LTKPEISSDLGSKPSYSKQEVVDIVYDILVANDEAMTALEARLLAENAARFAAYQATFHAKLAGVTTERDILWIAQTIVGAGLIVYGVYRNDVGTAATGVLMTGAGAVRLIIALE
jgi:hypothetical protein